MDPTSTHPSKSSIHLLPSRNDENNDVWDESFDLEAYENHQDHNSLPKFQSRASRDESDFFTNDDGTLNCELPTTNCPSKDTDNSSTTSSDTDSSDYSSFSSYDSEDSITRYGIEEEEEAGVGGLGWLGLGPLGRGPLRRINDRALLSKLSFLIRTTLKIRGKMSDTAIKKIDLYLTELDYINPSILAIKQSEVLRNLKAVLKRKEIPIDKEVQIRKRISCLQEKFERILSFDVTDSCMEKAQCKQQNQPVTIDLTSDREGVDEKPTKKRKRCTELATTTIRRSGIKRITVPDYMDMERGWIQKTLKTMNEIITNNKDIGEIVKVEKKIIVELVRNLKEYESKFLQVTEKWEKTR